MKVISPAIHPRDHQLKIMLDGEFPHGLHCVGVVCMDCGWVAMGVYRSWGQGEDEDEN